jgi:hypothetical protein
VCKYKILFGNILNRNLFAIYYLCSENGLQKGNPVKNRSCTRSCKPFMLTATFCHCPAGWRTGRPSSIGVSQKTCHFQKMLSGIKATVSLPDFLFPHVQLNKGE